MGYLNDGRYQLFQLTLILIKIQNKELLLPAYVVWQKVMFSVCPPSGGVPPPIQVEVRMGYPQLRWGPPAGIGYPLPRIGYAWTGYAAGGRPLAVFRRRTLLWSWMCTIIFTDRIRRMREGNVFSLFTPRRGVPEPGPAGGGHPDRRGYPNGGVPWLG